MKLHNLDDLLFLAFILLPAITASFCALASIPALLLGTVAAFRYYASKSYTSKHKLQAVYKPTLIYTLIMLTPTALVILFT